MLGQSHSYALENCENFRVSVVEATAIGSGSKGNLAAALEAKEPSVVDRSWTLEVWRKGWPRSVGTAAEVEAVDAFVASLAGMQQVAEMGRLEMDGTGIVERPATDWNGTVVARYQD